MKILYIDDEADLREIVTASLQLDSDIEVTTCATVLEARTLLSWSLPDLILLDVMMPGTDGPTFLAELRSHETTASIPVIFITARVRAQEVARFLALGAVGIVEKPFNPRTLGPTIRDLWRKNTPAHPNTAPEALDALQQRLRRKFVAEALVLSRRLLSGVNLDASHPDSAIALAHTLAGMAGTLGFSEIGHLAGEVDGQPDSPQAIEAKIHALAGLLATLGGTMD